MFLKTYTIPFPLNIKDLIIKSSYLTLKNILQNLICK